MDAPALGKTLRYLAFPLLTALAAGAQAQSNDAVMLQGIRLSVTSGTMELQRVDAESAIYNQDAESVLLADIDMKLHHMDNPPVSAEASRGMVVIGGWKPPQDPAAGARLTFDDIREYGSRFSALAHPGDLMLGGSEEPAHAEMGDLGSVRTDRIVWSETLRRIILPSPFVQEGTLEDGTKMTISGAALHAGRDLKDWTYFAGDDAEGSVVFRLPEEEDK